MDRHALWVLSDSMKRKLFLKVEIKRLLLRSFKRSRNIPLIKRYQASYYLTVLPKISSPNYYSNRCINSGRVWSVSKKTNSNRFIFRRDVFNSNLPGFRRASW